MRHAPCSYSFVLPCFSWCGLANSRRANHILCCWESCALSPSPIRLPLTWALDFISDDFLFLHSHCLSFPKLTHQAEEILRAKGGTYSTTVIKEPHFKKLRQSRLRKYSVIAVLFRICTGTHTYTWEWPRSRCWNCQFTWGFKNLLCCLLNTVV